MMTFDHFSPVFKLSMKIHTRHNGSLSIILIPLIIAGAGGYGTKFTFLERFLSHTFGVF